MSKRVVGVMLGVMAMAMIGVYVKDMIASSGGELGARDFDLGGKNRLVLRDANGKIRVQLGLDARGDPELRFCDANGEDVLAIFANQKMTGITLGGGSDVKPIYIRTSAGGAAEMVMCKKEENKGALGAWIRSESDGSCEFSLANGSGEIGVRITLTKDGKPSLMLDGRKNGVANLEVRSTGPSCDLTDGGGKVLFAAPE